RGRHANLIKLTLVCFAFALLFRFIDPLSAPILPGLGTHWLWHTVGAFTTTILAEYFYRLGTESIAPLPSAYDLRQSVIHGRRKWHSAINCGRNRRIVLVPRDSNVEETCGVRHLLRGLAEAPRTRRVTSMNIERFTEKGQEALRSAQRLTTKFGQQETDVEHLLLALLDDENGLATAVLSRAGVPVDAVKIRVQRELEKLPRVSGGRGHEGRFYVSGGRDRTIGEAQAEATKGESECVS